MIDGDLGCIAGGEFYHIRCFKCTMCNSPIDAKEGLYYIVDGYPYCKKDYIVSSRAPIFTEDFFPVFQGLFRLMVYALGVEC